MYAVCSASAPRGTVWLANYKKLDEDCPSHASSASCQHTDVANNIYMCVTTCHTGRLVMSVYLVAKKNTCTVYTMLFFL